MLDKLVHFGIYGILSLLIVIGLKKQYERPLLRFKAGHYAVGFSVIYGCLMEIIQLFIPDRGFDYRDMIANAIGGLSGYVIFVLIYRRF